MPRIVILGEDKEFCALLGHILTWEGHHVCLVEEASNAQNKLRSFMPQLLIVDSSYVTRQNAAVCRLINNGSLARAPLLLLQSDESRVPVVDLARRASACLKRPVEPNAVTAKVRAILDGRSTDDPAMKIILDEMVIEPLSYRVTRSGKVVDLSVLEFRLLHYLASHPNVVCRRDSLLNDVWENPRVTARAIDVYIRYLRRKIEVSPERPTRIKSVRGEGYMFCGNAQQCSASFDLQK